MRGWASSEMLGGGPPARMQPVGLLWDIENCPVPNDVRAEDVAVNIRQALRNHPIVGGPVTVFSAYGDFNQFPRKLREGCQRTGVNLIDVPNGRKDAADKAILVDLFLFAIDHPPPSTIFLISGDVDFSAALHKLSQRGYTIVLAHGAGSGQGVSLALSNAASHVWQWQTMARGQGLVAPQDAGWRREGSPGVEGSMPRPLPFPAAQNFHTPPPPVLGGPASSDLHPPLAQSVPPGPQRLVPTSALLRSASTAAGHPTQTNDGHVSRSEGHVVGFDGHPGLRKPESAVPGSQFLGTSPGENRHQERSGNQAPVGPDGGERAGVPAVSNGVTAVRKIPESSGDGEWARPGDIPALKAQLVELIRRNGGRLELVRVPPEYRKLFGRPLFLSEYGALKLHHLLIRMGDPLAVSGAGLRKTLHLSRGRATRPAYVARQPAATPAGQYWAGEASSSGDGEELEARRMLEGRVLKKVSKGGLGSLGVGMDEQLEGRPRVGSRREGGQTVGGEGWGSAPRASNGTIDGTMNEPVNGAVKGTENGTSNGTMDGLMDGMLNGMVDGTANEKETLGGARLEAREDEIFASLIEMDGSDDDVAGPRGHGWGITGVKDVVGLRRCNSERLPVVDLLSGEAFEPAASRAAEPWFRLEESARVSGTERTLFGHWRENARQGEAGNGTGLVADRRVPGISGRDELEGRFSVSGRNDSESVSDRNELEERGSIFGANQLEAQAESTERDEDEEQEGWRRFSSLRGGGVEKNRDKKQLGAYWEKLRTEPKKEHRSESARGNKGSTSDEGASSAGEGYAMPGTPEIVERR